MFYFNMNNQLFTTEEIRYLSPYRLFGKHAFPAVFNIGDLSSVMFSYCPNRRGYPAQVARIAFLNLQKSLYPVCVVF